MNIYIIILLILYGLNALMGVYGLSKGNTLVKQKQTTYGNAGFKTLVGSGLATALLLLGVL